MLGLVLNRADRHLEAQQLLARLRPGLDGRPAKLAVCDWQLAVAARCLRSQPGFDTQLEQAHQALTAAGLIVDAARCLRDLAGALNWRAQFTRSAEVIALARQTLLAHGFAADAALCALPESALLRLQGQYEPALAVLQEAEAVFAAEALPVELALVWLYQGAVYTACGESRRARPLVQAAESELQRLDLPARHAVARNELANIAIQAGRLSEARTIYAALAATLPAQGLQADLALAWFNLAAVHFYQGQLDTAMDYYRQSHAAFMGLGDTTHALSNEMNQGLVEVAYGRFGTGLRRLEQARAACEARDLRGLAAAGHFMLGHSWLALGNARHAAHHLAEAERLYTALRALPSAARAQVHRALAEARLGQTDAALQHVGEARALLAAAGLARYLPMCDHIAGEIHRHAGQLPEAVEHLGRAEQGFTAHGMPLNAAACRLSLAAAHLELGEVDTAASLFAREGERSARVLPEAAWRAAAGLALVAERRGQPEAALGWHRQAVRALSEARRWLQHELLVDAFLAGRQTALHRAVAAAVAAGAADLALAFVEETRAQILAQRVSQPLRAPGSAAGQPGHLRAAMAELRHRLAARLETAQPWLLRSPDAETTQLLDELDRLAQSYQEQMTLAEADGGDPDVPRPFDLAAVRTALAAAAPGGWTALAYYWQEGRLVTLMVTPDNLSIHAAELSSLQAHALDLFAAPLPDMRRLYDAGPQHNAPQARANLQFLRQLHTLLIPPEAGARLSPEHTLWVVPAGRLHALPMHALYDGDSYLCQRTAVVYTPSLAIAAALPQRAARLERGLVVALSEFGDGLPPLPQALEEARRVSAHLARADTLVNAAAARDAVLAALRGGHDLVHFATHAVFEASYGRLSRLVLHGDDLQADEIAQQRIAAGLAVLSGCGTAQGQVHSGEEVVGLTQAFFAAGVPSVIAAMWTLDDDLGPDLAAEFYAALRRRPGQPALALAEAQRAGLAAGLTPYAWAAYALHGRP